MADTALGAVYKVLAQHLKDKGNAGDRVYPEYASADVPRPYWIFHFADGQEENRRQRQDAEFIITVKCVSGLFDEALVGAEQIGQALNDTGTQDDSALPDNADWEITTVTQGKRVHYIEIFNAEPLWNSGHQFRVTMERK